MAYGYEKGFVIERDHTLRKRVNCYDCENADKSDYSCLKKGIHFPSDGSSQWKTCASFSLDRHADNYEAKERYYNDFRRKNGNIFVPDIEEDRSIMDLADDELKSSWLEFYCPFRINLYLYCIDKGINICKLLFKCEQIMERKKAVIDRICTMPFYPRNFYPRNEMDRVLLYFGVLSDELGCSIIDILEMPEDKRNRIISKKVLPLFAVFDKYGMEGEYYCEKATDYVDETVELIIENYFKDRKDEKSIFDKTTDTGIFLTKTKNQSENKIIYKVGINFINNDLLIEMRQKNLYSYVNTKYIGEVEYEVGSIAESIEDIVSRYR